MIVYYLFISISQASEHKKWIPEIYVVEGTCSKSLQDSHGLSGSQGNLLELMECQILD